MSYTYRARAQFSMEDVDSLRVAASGWMREVPIKAEVMHRLNQIATLVPIGSEFKIEKIYHMSRGYEPGKPRPGVVAEERIRLVDAGAWYDPKTGKPRAPKWRKVR